MPKHLKSERGFTYMEVMLSFVIFSIILSMGFGFYSHNQKLIEREIHSEEIQTHARTVLNRTLLELSYGDNLEKIDDLIVNVRPDGSFTPILDLSGYTERGRLNVLRETDGLVLSNEKGEVLSDKLTNFNVTEEGDIFVITVTVVIDEKEIHAVRKYYKHKL